MLERLGWAGEAFAFVEAKSASGTLKMDRAALEVIQAIANGGQLAILVKMMETLKKLGDGDRPIRIFDIQARRTSAAISRSARRRKAQRRDFGRAALSARRTTAERSCSGAGAPQQVKFWTAVRKMTLNPDLYGVHRAAVVAKLKADAADYVAELEIV